MDALRRALYAQAALWALAGLGLALAPRLLLVTLFGQPTAPEFAWVRLLGVQSLTVAMLTVLVAHRVDELWWWSWAFAFGAVMVAAIAVLNLAFGLRPGQSSILWWGFSGIALAVALALLYGLYVSSRERPIPWWGASE